MERPRAASLTRDGHGGPASMPPSPRSPPSLQATQGLCELWLGGGREPGGGAECLLGQSLAAEATVGLRTGSSTRGAVMVPGKNAFCKKRGFPHALAAPLHALTCPLSAFFLQFLMGLTALGISMQ